MYWGKKNLLVQHEFMTAFMGYGMHVTFSLVMNGRSQLPRYETTQCLDGNEVWQEEIKNESL